MSNQTQLTSMRTGTLWATLFLTVSLTSFAHASTAFTYQGQLRDSSGAVTSTCDMIFDLYDAASAGSPVSTQNTQNNVNVIDGFFTVQLDFGDTAFDGNERFLEIAVKCGNDTDFTALGRQSINPSPHASFAKSVPWKGIIDAPITLATLSCSDGQVAKWNETSDTWECADASTGSLTGVTAGSGLTGGGTSGDVTLNVDTTALQTRVAATCAVGESIRAINTDGSVTCEADDVGTGTVIDVLTGPGLAGGGTGSTVVTLSVDFTGSTGTADSVARSDHTHTEYGSASHNHTDAEVADDLTLNGGTIDNSVIGAATPAAGTFTNLTAQGNITLGDATSDTVTVNGSLPGNNPLVLEGATADDYETTLAVTEPTADQTITLPNASGTIILESTTACSNNQILKKMGTTWTCADASTGSLTGVTAGSGLTGGGTTGNVTLNVDTTALQTRVSASCAAGESIRAINADGSVTCEADDVGTGSVIDVLAGTGLSGGGTTGAITLHADFTGSTGTADSIARSDHTHTNYADSSATLAGLSCASGQVAKWDGSTWACDNDTDTTIADTDTLAGLSCTDGQVTKWNNTASAWECGTDSTIADTDTLAGLSCTSGQVAKWDGSTWACDNDTDTTIADTDTLAGLSCTDGQVTKWNNTASAWECGTDSTIADTLTGLSCSDGQVTKWNNTALAWECGTDSTIADTLTGLSCTDGQVTKWNNTALAWECGTDSTIADTLTGLSCTDGPSD